MESEPLAPIGASAGQVPADAAPTRKDSVASIAGQITKLSTGDHALLRRMYLTNKPAADGAVVKLLLYAGVQPDEYKRDYEAWRLLIHVAALLSGTSKAQSHNPRRGLGMALHDAGLSENRFLRLTAARGDALRDQVVLIGRVMAKAGKGAFNLRTLFDLIGRCPERAEKARLRMAQDYYVAAPRPEENSK